MIVIYTFNDNDIDFIIYNVGHLKLSDIKIDDDSIRDNTLKDTLIGIDFDDEIDNKV